MTGHLPPKELCFSSETSIRWLRRITAEPHTATSYSNHSRLIAPSQLQESHKPLRNRRSTCFKRAAESQHCSRITAEQRPHHSRITPKTKPNHSHITAASQPNHSHMTGHLPQGNCVSAARGAFDGFGGSQPNPTQPHHSRLIPPSQPQDPLRNR